MVEVGTGTSGTRFLRRDWPVEEGLTAGTTKLADDFYLIPQESKVSAKDRTGI